MNDTKEYCDYCKENINAVHTLHKRIKQLEAENKVFAKQNIAMNDTTVKQYHLIEQLEAELEKFEGMEIALDHSMKNERKLKYKYKKLLIKISNGRDCFTPHGAAYTDLNFKKEEIRKELKIIEGKD